MSKEIESGLVPYDYNKAEIAELAEKYKDITIPEGDKNAYEMVWQGIKECNRRINEVTEWHAGKKRWIIDAGRFYDKQKRDVVAEIEEIKNPLSELKKEADNLEKQRDEDRKEAIRENYIRPIQDAGAMLGNLEAVELADRLDFLRGIIFDDKFQELKEEASLAYVESRQALEAALEWRMAQDEKEAAQKIEEERLAKQKEEQDRIAAELKAKQDIIDAENKRIAEERAKLEAEQREAREKKEREELAERIRKEEQEKASIAAEKAETARKEKEAREAKEAQDKADREAKEVARLENLKPEKDKCLSYLELLSEIEQPKVEDKNLLALLKRMADGIILIKKLIQETK